MKKYIKNKNFIIGCIVISTFLLVVFNVYFYYYNSSSNTSYRNIKENNNLIVYTRYSKTYKDILTEVPYINLKTSIIGDLNNEIATFSNYYLNNDENVINYDYGISGDILSIVIQVNCYDNHLPVVLFKTYNINLKEKKLLNDADILDLYKINIDFVSEKIQKKFEYFFKDEREKKIFDEECDYSCYLNMRDIDNYTDKIHYYIDNAKLYVFKEFNIYSIYNEEKYFKNKDFKIEIAS